MLYQSIWRSKEFILLVPGMWNAHFTSAETDVLSFHVLLKYNFLIHHSILWKWNSKSKHSFPETWVQILIRSQIKWNSSILQGDASPEPYVQWLFTSTGGDTPTYLLRSDLVFTGEKKRATNLMLTEKCVCNSKTIPKIEYNFKFQISWDMWKASIKISVVEHQLLFFWKEIHACTLAA